ncbi:hypothetical protein BGZ79_009934, partial [Entomortierella chlamydospora]
MAQLATARTALPWIQTKWTALNATSHARDTLLRCVEEPLVIDSPMYFLLEVQLVVLLRATQAAHPAPQSDITTTTTIIDPKSKTAPTLSTEAKVLNVNSPGILPPSPVPAPGPTATRNRDNREKKSGQNVTSSGPVDEENQSSGSGSTSTGAVAAGIMAVFGFEALFIVAVVFSKRRRA